MPLLPAPRLIDPAAVPALRWGVVGTGIADRFVHALHAHTGQRAVAVTARDADKTRAFADAHGIGRVHRSVADLVGDPEVDVVYVATPHPLHREQALAAIAAGKHVLIEKPIALTAVDATEILAAGRAAGVLVAEAMWTRYLPHMARIREVVASGALGDIRIVMADHTQKISTDPTHRLNALELGGGALLDLGIYPISFAWDILGEPLAITASARLGETGADTEVATIMSHASGALSTSISASRSAGPNTASIIGTDARIDIASVWYNASGFRLVAPDGRVLEDYASAVKGRGMQYQALAAERLVAAGLTDSDILPIDETVAIMASLDEIRELIGVRYPGEE